MFKCQEIFYDILKFVAPTWTQFLKYRATGFPDFRKIALITSINRPEDKVYMDGRFRNKVFSKPLIPSHSLAAWIP